MIFLVALGALTAFVAAPLYRPRPDTGDARAGRTALEARRDVLLAELREIEADRASGALDEADHAAARDAAEAEAARILRALAD